MIFSAIFGIIKLVGSLIMNISAWLIVNLQLWIPFIYSVFFVIICALTDTGLSQASSLYFFGLIVSIFASFCLSAYKHEHKSNKKKDKRDSGGKRGAAFGELKEKEQAAVLKKKGSAAAFEPSELPPEPQKIQEEPPAYSFHKLEEDKPPEDPAFKALRGIFDNVKPQAGAYGNTPEPKPFGSAHHEPKIFATRRDPTIFIYEYPDRVDFYKRTRDGMVFFESRKKI